MSSFGIIPGGNRLIVVAYVIFGLSRSDKKVWNAGWNRAWNASRMMGAFDCESDSCRNKDAASSAFDVEGFSRRTCFFALSAFNAHS